MSKRRIFQVSKTQTPANVIPRTQSEDDRVAISLRLWTSPCTSVTMTCLGLESSCSDVAKVTRAHLERSGQCPLPLQSWRQTAPHDLPRRPNSARTARLGGDRPRGAGASATEPLRFKFDLILTNLILKSHSSESRVTTRLENPFSWAPSGLRWQPWQAWGHEPRTPVLVLWTVQTLVGVSAPRLGLSLSLAHLAVCQHTHVPFGG